jgi:hypothetical protein
MTLINIIEILIPVIVFLTSCKFFIDFSNKKKFEHVQQINCQYFTLHA